MWQGSFGWEGISYSKYGCFLCKIPVQRTDGLSFVENIHCSVDFHKNPTCGALERSDGGDWCWDQIGAVKAEQGQFPQASFIGDVLHQNSNWRISSQDWSWKVKLSKIRAERAVIDKRWEPSTFVPGRRRLLFSTDNCARWYGAGIKIADTFAQR